ncbi:ribosome silencing factor [Thiospirochaeta perfilievii]|uniref:Ribosomal silencing factor RsfS n=1 Tax=Thiospirochaeta perfilievii TaxID=252967 RepID=A0A5C1QGK8_9SPIO|nr:ribosome silencing factor [Thiospirochaeta perfilievii]QEN06210.1 ribosome silencing factor [Thiospirochaeta perfilievii]
MENVVINDVLTLAKEIEGLKGSNTLALNLMEHCSWTSYFIITTCSSNAHLKGVVNEIRGKIHSMGYSIKQNRKNTGDSNWVLLDCGDFIIHLMNDELREYYNLEELWKDSEVVYSSSSNVS